MENIIIRWVIPIALYSVAFHLMVLPFWTEFLIGMLFIAGTQVNSLAHRR